jgi:hypothetical protein
MRQTYLFDNYFQNIPAYMYMYIHVLGFHMYLHVGMVMMYTCLLNLQKIKTYERSRQFSIKMMMGSTLY